MSAASAIGNVVMTVIIIVIAACFNGWVMSSLWEWLIVPTFNVKSLSVAQAIGVYYFINVVLMKNNTESKATIEGDTYLDRLCSAVFQQMLAGLGALLFGLIISYFI